MPTLAACTTWRAASIRYATLYNAAGGAKVAPLLLVLASHFFNGRLLGGGIWPIDFLFSICQLRYPHRFLVFLYLFGRWVPRYDFVVFGIFV